MSLHKSSRVHQEMHNISPIFLEQIDIPSVHFIYLLISILSITNLASPSIRPCLQPMLSTNSRTHLTARAMAAAEYNIVFSNQVFKPSPVLFLATTATQAIPSSQAASTLKFSHCSGGHCIPNLVSLD